MRDASTKVEGAREGQLRAALEEKGHELATAKEAALTMQKEMRQQESQTRRHMAEQEVTRGSLTLTLPLPL